MHQSLEEQETTVRDLRREAEEARKALDSERKQVEGGFRFRPFSFVDLARSGFAPDFRFPVIGFQDCGPPWGIQPPRPRLCSRPTTPSNRSWRSCGSPPSRSARRLKKVRRRPGARWRVAYMPMRFTWASRRPLAWWRPTTRSTSRPCPQLHRPGRRRRRGGDGSCRCARRYHRRHAR
jgi:hypothetical protein